MEVLIGYAIFSLFTLIGVLVPSGADAPKVADLTQPTDIAYEERLLPIATNNVREEKDLVFKKQLRFVPPVKEVKLRSKFGVRIHPITKKKKFHYGVDLDGELGDPVLSVAPGIVTFVGKQRGYGNVIEIQHLQDWSSKYTHLEKIFVGKKQRVKAKQQIAKMGQTGRATGVHLHFELHHNDKAVNPSRFIQFK